MASISASDVQRTGNLLLKQKAAIQLEYENLSIRLDAERATVSVEYEFANKDGDDDVTIGFPVDLMPPPGDETSYNLNHWSEESLTGFQIYDSGEPVKIDQTIEEPLAPENRPKAIKDVSTKRRWFISKIHFTKGKRKYLRVNYTVRCIGVDRGFEGTTDGSDFTPRTFLYTLRPAGSFGNGRVGKLFVRIDASFLEQNRFNVLQVEPKPQGDRVGIFRWSFDNLDLKTAPDFVVSYDAKPALFQRWAERVLITSSEHLGLKILDGVETSARSLLDRNPETAWISGDKRSGVGASIRFRPLKDTYISEVALLNGAWASETDYAKYARIKKLRIEYTVRFANGPKHEVAEQILPDRKFDERALRFPNYYADFVNLPGGPEGTLEFVKLTVVDVYPGSESKQLAISELYSYGTDSHDR